MSTNSDVAALDAAILQFLADHPRCHPVSSPVLRRLAQSPGCVPISKLPYRVIIIRMEYLRRSGQYQWSSLGSHYKVQPS